MTQAQELMADMEATAKRVGLSASTIGERCGQGGQFYKRLSEGRRVWPETAEDVREKMAQIIAESASK